LAPCSHAPGDPERGHWIIGSGPYCEPLQALLVAAAAEAGVPARDGGCYGTSTARAFNTRHRDRGAAPAAGVNRGQPRRGGPEAVLCGEAELPYAA